MAKIFRELFTPTLNRIANIDQYVTSTPVVQQIRLDKYRNKNSLSFLSCSLQFLDLTKDL